MSINTDVRVFLEEVLEGRDMDDYECSFDGLFWEPMDYLMLQSLHDQQLRIRKKESKQPV